MTGSRSALIVACAEYGDPGLARLRAPAHDARALAGVLGDADIGNFQVQLVLDQPESLLRREVSRFFANREPEDTLLLHFSCHGVKDETGQLYFATSDTELDALDATALPAEFVHRQMSKSRSRRVVLLLDCCYSGAFARGMQHRADEGVDLQERFQGRGRTVLTASSAMEYAFEGDTLTRDGGTPSVFTSALVQGLRSGDADRGGDGYISVDELYDYVYEQVQQRTPGQTPRRWSFDVEGEVIIATSKKPVLVDLPAELQAAISSPFPGARLDAVPELARLLTGRHRGLTATARTTLETLRDTDDSQRVRDAAGASLFVEPESLARGSQSPHREAEAQREIEPQREAAAAAQREVAAAAQREVEAQREAAAEAAAQREAEAQGEAAAEARREGEAQAATRSYGQSQPGHEHKRTAEPQPIVTSPFSSVDESARTPDLGETSVGAPTDVRLLGHPTPGRLRWSAWRPAAVITVALLAICALAVVVVVENRSSLTDLKVVGHVKVGHHPVGIAFDADALWVTNSADGTVSRIDPTSNRVVATVKVGEGPGGVAGWEGAVWVANGGGGTVSRIDPTSNRVVATVKVGKDPGGVAAGAGAVWVTNETDGTVSRIDPTSNRVVATVKVGKYPARVAAGAGAVWVTNSGDGTVSRIDPASSRIETVTVGSGPASIAVDAYHAWVTSIPTDESASLHLIDSVTNAVVAVPVLSYSLGIAIASGQVWVASRSRDESAVYRFDASTRRLTAKGPLDAAGDLAVTSDAVWVTSYEAGEVVRLKR